MCRELMRGMLWLGYKVVLNKVYLVSLDVLI